MALRRILLSAVGALTVGLGAVSLLVGFSDSLPLRLLQGLAVFGAGAPLLRGATVLAMVSFAGWRDPESEREVEELGRRSQVLAARGAAALPERGEEDQDL